MKSMFRFIFTLLFLSLIVGCDKGTTSPKVSRQQQQNGRRVEAQRSEIASQINDKIKSVEKKLLDIQARGRKVNLDYRSFHQICKTAEVENKNKGLEYFLHYVLSDPKANEFAIRYLGNGFGDEKKQLLEDVKKNQRQMKNSAMFSQQEAIHKEASMRANTAKDYAYLDQKIRTEEKKIEDLKNQMAKLSKERRRLDGATDRKFVGSNRGPRRQQKYDRALAYEKKRLWEIDRQMEKLRKDVSVQERALYEKRRKATEILQRQKRETAEFARDAARKTIESQKKSSGEIQKVIQECQKNTVDLLSQTMENQKKKLDKEIAEQTQKMKKYQGVLLQIDLWDEERLSSFKIE